MNYQHFGTVSLYMMLAGARCTRLAAHASPRLHGDVLFKLEKKTSAVKELFFSFNGAFDDSNNPDLSAGSSWAYLRVRDGRGSGGPAPAVRSERL